MSALAAPLRYADRYGVQHMPQGLVDGKRCGVSESLGPASRNRSRLDERFWTPLAAVSGEAVLGVVERRFGY
jgi:hypothetical protein